MALGCGITSMRSNSGENYEKRTAGLPKTNKAKKTFLVSHHKQTSLKLSYFSGKFSV
jgi:hypothetical protein